MMDLIIFLRSATEKKLGSLVVSPDPYVLLEQGRVDGDSWQDWPDVEYADLFCYLIETNSDYTGESLKAYKSLESYN